MQKDSGKSKIAKVGTAVWRGLKCLGKASKAGNAMESKQSKLQVMCHRGVLWVFSCGTARAPRRGEDFGRVLAVCET